MSECKRFAHYEPTGTPPSVTSISSHEVVLASDHDRIIAERDVEIERQRNALEAVVGTLRMAAQSNLDSAERELLHDIANDIAQKHYPEGESLRESNVQLIAEIEALTADNARLLAECDGLRQRREGVSMKCAKCGGIDMSTRFHLGNWSVSPGCSYYAMSNREDEHLHRICRVCGWDWTDDCADIAATGGGEGK